jgi:hypothetical protein
MVHLFTGSVIPIMPAIKLFFMASFSLLQLMDASLKLVHTHLRLSKVSL